ncbi:MAG: transporter, partial [Gemmatimonadetes bacterium]|nr:transporter [Gemmatimonadota bacterium]NIT68795.1 transporter [Gemmatimonadota bacterium]NIY37372.1 transporter [Gemmatimonadota bacterium]
MRTRIRRATTALVATGVALAAGGAQGSGFALVEQSVKGLGNAFAGGAAVAEDPSTVYWNPAGLTRLDEPRFNLAAYVISPSSEFDNQGSTASPGTPLQAPLTGGDGGNGA